MLEIASLTVSISKLRHYTNFSDQFQCPLFLNILDPPLQVSGCVLWGLWITPKHM